MECDDVERRKDSLSPASLKITENIEKEKEQRKDSLSPAALKLTEITEEKRRKIKRLPADFREE